MSFDEDFSRAYRHTVERQPLPDGLVERTLKTVRETEKMPGESAAQTSDGAPCSPKRPSAAKATRWKRPALAGACLAAAAALALAAPAVLAPLNSLGQSTVPQSTATNQEDPDVSGSSDDEEIPASLLELDDTAAGPGMHLRAYADDGSELIGPQESDGLPTVSWGSPHIDGEAPIALFYPSGASGTGGDTMWPEGDSAITVGFFSAETFTVEGSNIQRVQIHTSRDELFVQTIDRNVTGTRKIDLTGFDPRQRGKRPGYEDCDTASFYDHFVKDDQGEFWSWEDAFHLKRFGTNIDLSKKNDERVGTRDLQFGILAMATTDVGGNIWMTDPSNYSYPNVPVDLNQPDISLGGIQLTITVTYDDGTCETQVIDLHQIDVVADREGTPITPLRLFDEKASLRGEYADGEGMVTITYGTLVSKSNEPFPYADEPANQYASEVMPPMPVWPQGN